MPTTTVDNQYSCVVQALVEHDGFTFEEAAQKVEASEKSLQKQNELIEEALRLEPGATIDKAPMVLWNHGRQYDAIWCARHFAMWDLAMVDSHFSKEEVWEGAINYLPFIRARVETMIRVLKT